MRVICLSSVSIGLAQWLQALGGLRHADLVRVVRAGRVVALQRLGQSLGRTVSQRASALAIVSLMLKRAILVLVLTLFPHLPLAVRRKRGNPRSEVVSVAGAGLLSLLSRVSDSSPVIGVGAGLLVHELGSL